MPLSQRRPRSRWPAVIGLSLALVALLAGISSLALRKAEPKLAKIQGGGEVQQVFGGVPQDGNRLGPDDAPVTIQVFNDLQCTPCADWDGRVTVPLANGLARPGQARMIFHFFPMGEKGREVSFPAAAAAGDQGRLWQYVNLFFRNQGQAKRGGVTDQFLRRIAAGIPDFDVPAWQRARGDTSIESKLSADDKLAANLGLPAEPAVIVNGPGGTRQLINSPSLSEIQAAVSAVR